ncbi:MAG: HlyD family secretion protein [bacterium]
MIFGLFAGCARGSSGRGIATSGIVEAERVLVAAEVAGKLEEITVDEGNLVKQGDALARIESGAYTDHVALEAAMLAAAEANFDLLKNGPRNREIEVAKRNLDIAHATYALVLKTPRPEQVAQAEAQAQKATAAAAKAEADYKRAQAIHAEGAISDSELERARLTHVSATQDAAVAREQLSLLKSSPLPEEIEKARKAMDIAELNLQLLAEGSREEAVRQAEAQMEARRASYSLAKRNLERTSISAPMAGRVVRLIHRVGEVLSPGSGICELVDETNLWLRVYVPETQIGSVKIGASAHISIDALPREKIVGRVTAIDSEAMFTPSNIQTKEARATLVFGVKIKLEDNLGGRIKPGMPADATIDLQ